MSLSDDEIRQLVDEIEDRYVEECLNNPPFPVLGGQMSDKWDERLPGCPSSAAIPR